MRLFFNDFSVLDPLQLWWKSENEHIPYNIKPKPHPSFFEHMSKTWYYLNLIDGTFSYTRRDCCQFVCVCECVGTEGAEGGYIEDWVNTCVTSSTGSSPVKSSNLIIIRQDQITVPCQKLKRYKVFKKGVSINYSQQQNKKQKVDTELYCFIV